MASHCPSCGRVLGPSSAPAESPCCAATRRGLLADERAAEVTSSPAHPDPFSPEDFGLNAAPASQGPVPEAELPVAPTPLTLRPRLVAVAPVEAAPVASGGASPQVAPDPATAPRERTRRLPAGIRLVISRRGRRPAARRAEGDAAVTPREDAELPPTAPGPPPEPAAAPPVLPPVAPTPEAAPAPMAAPAPAAPAALAPAALTTAPPRPLPSPRQPGVFGPLGQAHFVARAEPSPSASVARPVIAPRAQPAAATPGGGEPLGAAPRRTQPSQSFALPFDERASLPPEATVAAEAPEVAAPAPHVATAPTPAPQPPRPRPAQPIRPRSQDAPARVAPPPAPPRHRLDARSLGVTLLHAVAQISAIPAAFPPLLSWLAAIAGAALLVWVAPPIAGAFLAALGLALAHRAEQDARPASAEDARSRGADPRARVAEALGWGGLAASLASLALGLALADGRGVGAPLPSSPLPWPAVLFGPGALVGLALTVAAGTRLAAARQAPFLAATAGPAMAVALISTAGLRWGGVLVVSSGLVAAASWGCWQRYVARPLRNALTAWAVVGGVALLAATIAIASGYRPVPVASSLALGLLAAASVGAAAQLARGYEERQQRTARALAMLAVATLAAALVLAGRALSLPLATCVALTPLAPVMAGVAALVQRRRAMLRIETAWLPRDARIAAAAAVVLLLAALPWPGAGANAWTLAVALLTLSAFLSVQRALDGSALTVAGAATLAIGSIAAGLAGVGVPLAWLSPAASLMIAVVALVCPRLPGRLTREAWTPVALVSLGACLVASIAACALGEVAAGLAGAGIAALAPLALAGRRGIAELGHSLLAGRLPEGRSAGAVAALQLGVLAFLPLAPLVTLGLWPWAAPALAAEALGAALLSRWRPTLLHPAAWLVVGSAALLPLVAHPAGWIPGLVALGLLTLTGGLEFMSRGDASRGTHRSSAELLAAAGLCAVAWAGAGLSVAPIVLLAAAVCAQVLDAVVSDAILARALRRASVIAWLAAILVGLGRAVIDPAQGAVLLGGGAVTGLLLFLLRRERWPLLVGGLSLAAAASCGLLLVGAPAGEHPTLHVASLAGVLIAWGTLESRRGAPASEWLLLGLGTLAAALALEAHLPGSPALLRGVAVIAGLGMVAAGVLSRHRVPLQVGAVLLAVELLWLAGQGAAWAVAHPALGAGLVVLAAAGIAGLVARLSWRAGGSAALWLAWSSDIARAREAWSHWR